MITEETIKARIEQLKQERDKFVAEANQTVAAYNGAISELDRLLAVDNEPLPADNG